MPTTAGSADEVRAHAVKIGYEIAQADYRADAGDVARLARKLRDLRLPVADEAIALVHGTLLWASAARAGGADLPADTFVQTGDGPMTKATISPGQETNP
jgi:hypothetical protein